MKNLKNILIVTILFSSSFVIGQNKISENSNSVSINGISVEKGSQSFDNLFELKEKSEKVNVEFGQFKSAFKVSKVYKNKTIIKVVNTMYLSADSTKQYIRSLNESHNIVFVR